MDGSVSVHPQACFRPFVFVYLRVLPACECTKDSFACFACWLTEDVWHWQAGVVELAAVELQTDDGKHEDGEEQQQANLQQGHHGLDDGLQHDLKTCRQTRDEGIGGCF